MAQDAGKLLKGPAKPEKAKSTFYVVLRASPGSGEVFGETGVKIGEKLEVVQVIEAASSDAAHRAHKAKVEKDWRDQRAKAKPADKLPDVFPVEKYRCVSLSSFLPGYGVEEQRDTKASLW